MEEQMFIKWVQEEGPVNHPKLPSEVDIKGEVTLTHEVIMSFSTNGRGAWNRDQLAILGVSWPPKKGWKSRLTGRKIPREDYRKLVELTGLKRGVRRQMKLRGEL